MHDPLHPKVLTIGISAHLRGLFEDLPIGTAVPVAVGLGPHVFMVGELADTLIHVIFKSIREAHR
jgi:hypothetical protein